MTASDGVVLSVDHVSLDYSRGSVVRRILNRKTTAIHALIDVSLQVREREILGVVGESGSGKSSLARVIAGIQRASSGTVTITAAAGGSSDRRGRQSSVQMVFQDSFNSLNPEFSALQTVSEAYRVTRPGLSGRQSVARARELLLDMGLTVDSLGRRPLGLSGGQRQRVNLARAIACEPRLIVADEPTSALDVTTRLRTLELIRNLRDRYGIAFMFISHDLNVIRFLCDRAVVMQHGRVVEEAPVQQIFEAPADPYTRELIASTPSLREVLAGYERGPAGGRRS